MGGPPNHSRPSGAFTSLSPETTVLAASPYWCVHQAEPKSAPERRNNTYPSETETSAPSSFALPAQSAMALPPGRHATPPYGRSGPNTARADVLAVSRPAAAKSSDTIRFAM